MKSRNRPSSSKGAMQTRQRGELEVLEEVAAHANTPIITISTEQKVITTPNHKGPINLSKTLPSKVPLKPMNRRKYEPSSTKICHRLKLKANRLRGELLTQEVQEERGANTLQVVEAIDNNTRKVMVSRAETHMQRVKHTNLGKKKKENNRSLKVSHPCLTLPN